MLDSMLDDSQLGPERPRLLRRVEYDRLVAEGFFDDERVELLHGVLVTMSASFEVRSHSPFAASDYSEPEPDVGVYPRGSVEDHRERAFLLVEVADSSLSKDRRIKTGIYAAAGVPAYWIVDLQHERIEVLTEPDEDEYQQRTTLRRGDVLRPANLPGVALAVADILR
jgi:Uma2 family endonuclease